MKDLPSRDSSNSRAKCILHIYDARNPKAGCYCCSPGDLVSVIAPAWAIYIQPDHLCGNCAEIASAAIPTLSMAMEKPSTHL